MTKHQKNRSQLTALLLTLCCLSLILMIITAVGAAAKGKKAAFTPPEFDNKAILGFPDVPENMSFAPIEVEQGYELYVCADITVKRTEADIYFTAPESNKVWLMLQVIDGIGNTLGETGIIRPGEYVRSLSLSEVPGTDAEGTEATVKLKIIAYQPETYISMGSVSLNAKLNKQE